MKLQTSIFVLCAIFAQSAHAVDFPGGAARASAPTQQAPTPFSQSGLIQNVQSYSSNPYYNPDSPYYQRLPVPIYAQGTELNAGDCQYVAGALVSAECGRRNNCAGLRVGDIRPAVLQQMAAIPGHNYMSQCNGFIDGAFDEYMKSAQNVRLTGFPTMFPGAGTGGAGAPGSAVGNQRELVLINPTERQLEDWEIEKSQRQNELAGLRAANAEDTTLRAGVGMPGTFADLSFAERMEVLRQGYQPYANNKAYQNIKIESNVDALTRERNEMEARKDLADEQLKLARATNYCEWCKARQTECLSEQNAIAKQRNEPLIKAACPKWSGEDTNVQIAGWLEVYEYEGGCFGVRQATGNNIQTLSEALCPQQAAAAKARQAQQAMAASGTTTSVHVPQAPGTDNRTTSYTPCPNGATHGGCIPSPSNTRSIGPNAGGEDRWMQTCVNGVWGDCVSTQKIWVDFIGAN